MALRQCERLQSLGARLGLRERVENELSNAFVSGDVGDRAEQREASALAVDRVLAGRERDVPAAATPTLPDAEPGQLKAGESRFATEVEFSVREFACGVAGVVGDDLDGEGVRAVVGLHCLLLVGNRDWFLHVR